jgi:hypothetical protein
LNVLEIAKEEKIDKIFWPSSIAVFGVAHLNKTVHNKLSLNPLQFMESANMLVNSGAIITISDIILM